MGGHYETFVDDFGVSRVTMSLVIYVNKPSDFGVYKCVAKNALGTNEEVLKVTRKHYHNTAYSSTFIYLVCYLNTTFSVYLFNFFILSCQLQKYGYSIISTNSLFGRIFEQKR